MKICLYAFFPRFQLTIDVPALFFLSVLSLFFQIIVTQPHSISFYIETPTPFPQKHWMTLYRQSFYRVVTRITKYISRCLDKQWHQCLISLITYNITTVLSIIAWHLIRYHHLVYIDRKYISYLSLSIKVFGCNLLLTKFQHLYYIFLGKFFDNFMDRMQIKWAKAIFLSLVFRR